MAMHLMGKSMERSKDRAIEDMVEVQCLRFSRAQQINTHYMPHLLHSAHEMYKA